jgi:hypothetical protein
MYANQGVTYLQREDQMAGKIANKLSDNLTYRVDNVSYKLDEMQNVLDDFIKGFQADTKKQYLYGLGTAFVLVIGILIYLRIKNRSMESFF